MKIMIQKIYVKILFISIALIGLGCSNDFLDEPKNTNGIAQNDAFTTRGNVDGIIAGMMNNYKRQWDEDITDDDTPGGSNSIPDLAGLFALYFARTVKGNDVIQDFGFYDFDYEHDRRAPGTGRVRFTWFFNYQSINYANVLIEGVTNSTTLSEADKNEFIAVGKAIRAFHYFQLALEFAPNYNNDRSIARFPLYLSSTRSIVAGNAPVALSVIYNQIIRDLNEALPDLPTIDQALGKSFIHKAFANVLLTRVLQVTQDDWDAVSRHAKAAYGEDASAAVVSSNWGNGFNDLSDQEWLWGHFQSDTETNFFWLAPHVFTDHLTLSFRATYFNPNFVNQFTDTDVRNLFQDIENISETIPWREFVSTKFAFTFDADAPLMRKSEMVLADAEAQFHLGNIPGAQSLLFTLQSARDPEATASGNTGQDLLNEILLERRKELYGEIGVEWFDAKRYALPIDRDPVHRIEIDVPANSELFFLNIPQSEIDANINIEDLINN